MKRLLLAAALIFLAPAAAEAACSTTYPVGDPNDGIVSFVAANGGGTSVFAATTYQPVSEGTLTYDTATHTLQLCNGTAWLALMAGSTTPGGTDTQLQFNDAGALAGAAQLLWDKATNRLAIGSTSPASQTLDVTGTATANTFLIKATTGLAAPSTGTGAIADLSDVTITSPSTGQVLNYNGTSGKWENATAASQWANGTGGAIYYNGGNVGIGTTTGPAEKLDIAGDSNVIVGSGGGGVSSLTVNPTSLSRVILQTAGTAGYDELWFAPNTTTSDSPTPVLVMKADNVGIGTEGPDRKLHVNGGAVMSALGTGGTFKVSSSTVSGGTLEMGIHTGTGALAIQANTQDTNVVRNLLLQPFGGNVGIGTENPSTKLNVNGTFQVQGDSYLGTSGGTQGILYLYGSTAGRYGRVLVSNGNMHLDADMGNSGTGSLYLDYYQGASVIVGSGTNRNNLIVYGASITCTIGSGNGATNCTSDERLKKDIQPISGALDKILALRGVTYHWKDPSISEPEHIGVIAQEVEKVFPQAVGAVSDATLGTAKTVDMSALIAPTIEAIRELKSANDNLVAENKHLQDATSELRAQIKVLSNRLDARSEAQ